MKRMLFLFLICMMWLGVSQAQATNADRLSHDIKEKPCPAALLVRMSDQRHDQAMLSDARTLYRLCNTRPQRLVPIQGAGNGKSHGKPSFATRTPAKPVKAIHDRRRKAETLPLRLVASCDYYVIALRHIIR